MGKNLICEICHLSFTRVRALRRHCCPRKEIPRLLDHPVARPHSMTKAGRTNRYARWNPRQPRPSRPPRRVSLSRPFRRSHPRPPWRHSHRQPISRPRPHRPPTSSRRKARTPRLCSHCQPAHHPRPLRPGGPPRRSCRGRRKAPCRPRGRFFQLAVTPLPHTSDSVHHRIIIPSRNSSPTWRSPETRPRAS